MLTANLIAKKRDAEELREDEIRFLIEGYCDGKVAEYQMSAWAMAVCLRGMSDREVVHLTDAMLRSGDQLSRDVSDGTPRVDKHSTGGLGDKVSLVLAPLMAACGLHVPMISGRGLGITGGTLDKLEAIPGFRTDLTVAESEGVLRDAGSFIIGTGSRIAPADQRLYALRDVTGTVESIPLITASILSKKLAANLEALVVDVKVGSGAFMKSRQQADLLAQSLVRVGRAAGLETRTLLSDMDQPLGQAVGNAIEVNEAITLLSEPNAANAAQDRVRELTLRLATDLLVAAGGETDPCQATRRAEQHLNDGSAMARFESMVARQGGRLRGHLEVAEPHVVEATGEGFVESIDCEAIGRCVIGLGGGRRKLGDPIDPSVGVSMQVLVGDRVQRGQPILRLHCHRNQTSEYVERLRRAVVLSEQPVSPLPLLL